MKQLHNFIPNEIAKAFLRTKGDLPELDSEITVRAIDIGYGYTKYTKAVHDNGQIECDLFPSVASVSPMDEMGGDFFVSRDTQTINVGGTIWEVGPDVGDIKSTNDVRALHDNFTQSEQWKVLLLGALAYMETDEIDYLILGLPVSDMKLAKKVEENATGKHKINDDKTVNVKKVFVIPQPLGTLYNYAIKNNEFDKFMTGNTLVVDPGYLTFDFLVTKGFSVNAHRSGARPGGMNSILSAIANSISQEHDVIFEDYEQIDQALKEIKQKSDTPRIVYLYGREINLDSHIPNTKPVIDSSMNYMLQKIGTSKDINRVILGGGPNKIYHRSIQGQFPHHEILKLEDGIFSNVTGFLLWGLMTSFGLEIKAKK